VETIIEYLHNPIQTGVYNGLYKIDLTKVENILEMLSEEGGNISFVSKQRLRRLREGEINIRNCLPSVISSLACRTEKNALLDYYNINDTLIEKKYKDNVRMYRSRDPLMLRRAIISDLIGFKPFKPHIYSDANEVLIIDDIEKSDSISYLEVTSIKDIGINKFERFIMELPYINDTFDKLKYRQTHSTRYVFRPYYLAVKLWINKKEYHYTHKDLINLLEAAIQYYTNQEWRTSIILSSICVESMLADIYEEALKTDAPDIPLGALFEKIKREVKIPDEIITKIESLNKSRISAAHRSKYPISDREATIALFGVVSLLLWYNANY
jgi:HEPN domain-containing protein